MNKQPLQKQHRTVHQPEYLWYSDFPPSDPRANPRKISPQELEAIIGNGYQYSENVHTAADFTQQFAATTFTDSVKQKVLNRVRTPLSDKLIICNMGPVVGHGLFARTHIAMGEVIAIYTGELTSRSNEQQTHYSFDVSDKKDSSFCIDANKIGGLARFLQHMPYNPELVASQLIPLFKKQPSLIRTFLEMYGIWNDLEKKIQPTILANLRNDVQNGTGEHISGMLVHNHTENELFETRNIEFTQYCDVAYANCLMSKLVIDPNKPIMYVHALTNLSAGALLGFSYGIGYWTNMGLLPLLFNSSGQLIDRLSYHYTKMPICMTAPNKKLKAIPYTQIQYQAELGKHEAVLLSPFHAVSFFKIRKLLVRNNVLTQKHDVRQDSLFVQHLKRLLPDDVTIETFDRFPDALIEDEQYIFDVVCKTSSFQRWAQLTQFLRNDPIIGHFCKSLRYSGEVIIKAANQHPKELYQFACRTTPQKANVFFATPIPASQLPDDPGYNHPFPHLK